MNKEIIETNSKPLFEKRTVAELSDHEMMNVDGGSTTFCLLASSQNCAIAVAAVVVIVANSL